MNVITDFNVIIDSNGMIDFYLGSDNQHKSENVSLLSISLLHMYGRTNFIKSNNKHIHLTKNLLEGNVVKNKSGIPVEYDYSWQYELQVEIMKGEVYIEKWGISTKLSGQEYLKILSSINDFLNRWQTKEKLIAEVEPIFDLYLNNKSDEINFESRTTRDGDKLLLFHKKENNTFAFDDFINRIEWPIHMT